MSFRRASHVLGAISSALALGAWPCHARAGDTAHPLAQFHFDIYLLHVSRADLHATPIFTDAGTHLAGEAGVEHPMTFGFTPYSAPHFGLGVELPGALFYVHGGYFPWGIDHTEAQMAVLQTTAAIRFATDPIVVSMGPSAGVWRLAGNGWHTRVLGLFGVESELRFRAIGHSGKHGNGPPSSSFDPFFLRFTQMITGGTSFIVSIGQGWGTLPTE